MRRWPRSSAPDWRFLRPVKSWPVAEWKPRGRGLCCKILLRRVRLVEVGEDLVFHTSAIAALTGTLEARKGQRFSVPEFKEWTKVSRKYAIPLLEFLDRERRTRREGDSHMVL